jgi:hypothetical protein
MPALVKKYAATVSVTDIKLAASLMALGIPPVPGEEVAITTGDANRVAFNFLPHGEGDMSAEAIIAAWRQEREAQCREDEWSHKNPDHPLSYLMCAWDNFLCVRDYVRKATPKVYMKRGKSVALIDPERGPKKLTDYILGKIGA